MQGSLSEFTLAQLLQFFALAERSGAVMIRSSGRESRLLVESDRIVGWGMDDYDVRDALLACELLTPLTRAAIDDVDPRADTPGLSFVIRNLVEPRRWDAFIQRQLEQDIYPLLSVEDGDFEIQVMRTPAAPLRLSLPVNSLILDGSRWESEMEAAIQDGYLLDSRYERTPAEPPETVRLSQTEWLVWAALDGPTAIADVAQRLCLPDLDTIGAIKRLRSANLLRESN